MNYFRLKRVVSFAVGFMPSAKADGKEYSFEWAIRLIGALSFAPDKNRDRLLASANGQEDKIIQRL